MNNESKFVLSEADKARLARGQKRLLNSALGPAAAGVGGLSRGPGRPQGRTPPSAGSGDMDKLALARKVKSMTDEAARRASEEQSPGRVPVKKEDLFFSVLDILFEKIEKGDPASREAAKWLMTVMAQDVGGSISAEQYNLYVSKYNTLRI